VVWVLDLDGGSGKLFLSHVVVPLSGVSAWWSAENLAYITEDVNIGGRTKRPNLLQ